MRILLMLSLLACLGAVVTLTSHQHAEEEEDLWWEAPSRKADLYSYKYEQKLQQLNRLAARQGEDFRLPRDILPSLYSLQLLPFIEVGNFTTNGFVEIYVTCFKITNNITMNAADLIIYRDSVRVVDMATNLPLFIDNFIDEQDTRETITIQVAQPLRPDRQYKVSMSFVSFLNDELRGFYRSSYVENGVTKYLAVSQMEAPDARRSFPCFDEPNMKARFGVTLGRRTSMSSLSNMRRIGSNPIADLPGYNWDYYQTSVPMSTYLVAFVVSEFVNTPSDPNLSPTVQFGIWARPSFAGQTEYPGNIGPRILEYFSKSYFNISFPLQKIDMIAVPDFAAGAMENWGLITYREADLLFDPQRSSEVAKQRCAIIIAHELAHQWFGNLVTMDWWNVIWLNEGFATYMEYIGTDSVEPGFEMNDQITVVDMHYVFGIDALESSRPINLEVNTPAEINQMFDAISYEKGGCVLRMLANFVGLETFQRGVTRYLNDNAYGNTVEDDLWTALQTQADLEGVDLPASVKEIMDSWTVKMGFPVITVIRDYFRESAAMVTQSRFLLRKNPDSTDTTVYRWWVPLTFTKNFSNPQETFWMSPDTDRMFISDLSANHDQWVIFNVDQVGYYRVSYDVTNLEMIRQQLMSDHLAIPIKNRAQVLDDYLNFARANMTNYETALDLTRYLVHERDYVPWTAAVVALDYLDIMLYGYLDYVEWKNYMSVLVDALYQHVNFNESSSDSHLLVYTRSHAIGWACVRLGSADCIQNAQRLFSAWMRNPDNDNLISANSRRWITCTAIANGGQAEWDFAFQKYSQSNLGNEKTDFLRAMPCSKRSNIIYNMLEMMINPNSGIRLQDANTWFSNIVAYPLGHTIALSFLANRWDDIYNYFYGYQGFGGGSVPSLFRSLCNRANTQSILDQLKKIRNDHMDVLGSSKTVQQGLELAESNVQWVNKHYDTVINWLKNRVDETTTVAPTTTPSTTSPSPSPTTDANTSPPPFTLSTSTIASPSTASPSTASTSTASPSTASSSTATPSTATPPTTSPPTSPATDAQTSPTTSTFSTSTAGTSTTTAEPTIPTTTSIVSTTLPTSATDQTLPTTPSTAAIMGTAAIAVLLNQFFLHFLS